MSKQETQRGSITLETSIILPIFIIMFLFIYGLFAIVSAQNQLSHAFVQSTKSMSLDSYLTENVESAGEAGTKFWAGLPDMVLDLVRINNDPFFTSQADWYKSASGNSAVAKKRFVGYLAGGDEQAARQKCKDLKIVNGLDGINFTTQINDEIMTITMKYEIQYWFDFWDMGKVPVEQTIKVRLWM